ncbi:MAG: hypothetical protein AB7F76_05225 [Parvibaculaceae bacterium]
MTSFSVPRASGPLVTLTRGALQFIVAPEAGARFVSFTADGRDILRTASPQGLNTGTCYEYGGFPLVPYSGPIFGDGFRFGGEFHALGRTVPEEPTATHGEGWIRPWQILRQDAAALRLQFDHVPRPDAFPFGYRGVVDFSLEAEKLVIDIELICRHHRPMPAGIGIHPYFPKPAGTALRFDATGLWPPDSPEAVEQGCGPLEAGLDFRNGQDVSAIVFDRCFEGWDGLAELSYPDGHRTRIEAEGALTRLQIYDAWHYPYIYVEPVSNANDGFNRMALGVPGHGVQVLEPGQSLSGRMSITPL